MTKRARLRYFDSNNNAVVIGSINESGTSGIDQLTLRNSGRQFTKATVVGGQELFGKFPTQDPSTPDAKPQNNASGPEIFLEVFNQSTGQFEVRDRLYAESQGVVTDGGRFKHKRLYGFEKFVGRQKVEITEANAVTSDIEQVLKDVLPTGYSVQAEAPSGGSIPSVNSYTVNGSLNSVFQDLQENYNYFVFFTGQTDGSGNYIVRLEPRGFGGQVDTFEKGVDPVFFDKWTKGDELRRVTEAQVIGTDGSGNTIKETASTNPNNGRFKRKNVGYITDSAEAKDIAVNLIAADSDGGTPESTEHGKITAPLDEPATSNLNKSIQIINDQINVDDLFTVVEQRDFFHQSQTQYSFEFEKELTTQEQQDKKDLGNRNAELITEEQTDVGQQSFTGDTGSAPSDTQRDPNTGIFDLTQGESMSTDFVNVQRSREEQGGATISLDSNGNGSTTVFFDSNFDSTPRVQVTPVGEYVDRFRVNNKSSSSVDIQALNGPANTDVDFDYFARQRLTALSSINFDVEVPPSITEIESAEGQFGGATFTLVYGNQAGFDVDVRFLVENTDTGETYVNFVDNVPDGQNRVFNDFVSIDNTSISSGDTLNIDFETQSVGSAVSDVETADDSLFNTRVGYITQSINKHNHDDDIDTEDFDHGGSSDPTQHGTSGSTDSKNVQTGTEEKVNR